MSEYDVLILAGGGYDGLPADAIQSWVQSGGTLIALEDAVDWPVENEMVDLEDRSVDVDSLVRGTDYADLQEAYGAQYIGGTIFQAQLDDTHPIAYGYDDDVPVFRLGTNFYTPSDQPGASVGTYDDETPRVSGYISDDQTEPAKGAASIEAHRVGGGNVVLFMDNPNFRAFWYGTNGLFLNAITFRQTY